MTQRFYGETGVPEYVSRHFRQPGGGQYAGPPQSPEGGAPGLPPAPNPTDPVFQVDVLDPQTGLPTGERTTDWSLYYQAYADWQSIVESEEGGTPGTDWRPGELELEQRREARSDYATFLDSVIAGTTADIENRRLKAEQAVDEFNRRLDALSEAAGRYEGIQPYTILPDSRYIPGFEPGGVGAELGLGPRRATPQQYDPFQIAQELLQSTPNIADIGVPDLSSLRGAIGMARRFAGQ